jgi:dihydroorotate dehydrogenase
MVNLARTAALQVSKLAYQAARPMLFRRSAQQAHEDLLHLLTLLDQSNTVQAALRAAQQLAFPNVPRHIGGVDLPHTMILGAGLVKGLGFDEERDALAAARRGHNLIPGWRTLPSLVGPVEFGSYTRWPRMGNRGQVIWRRVATRSTQNRVGLKNPGAVGAAAFLARHQQHLPPVYGINIAVSPGVVGTNRETRDVLESMRAFTARGVYPSWFTLNLSCPNTDDDPQANQTEAKAREMCSAIVAQLAQNGLTIPLWVKVGPALAPDQYAALMRAFAETGVRAVVATNTLAKRAPDGTTAGVGGGVLHREAVRAAGHLMAAREQHGLPVDVIGCGGVQDPASLFDFTRLGVVAVQYWSALVYRGPLAAALILDDAQDVIP